ncbi:coproporphyrinogen III oxidase [Spirochaetia bacterium]|nr:coproporphyrinogen III oxidase [Spirochaetia bacterium]
MTAAVYIHIPFCKTKCGYCDFYSIPEEKSIFLQNKPVQNEIIKNEYIKKLCADIEFKLKMFSVTEVNSVYIGGGTPSSLGAKHTAALLSFLQKILPNKPLEFTIEANPESMDADFLSACREGGVDRISVGVQSFNEKSRSSVGRLGGSDMLMERLALLAGYYNDFSADLMSGLPYQNEKILVYDITTLLRYKPSHISFYDLSVEENTPLWKLRKSGNAALTGTEEAEKLWIYGRDILEKSGFEQYEVSNFAYNGKRSLHNINYWRMGNWLGVGAAASGTIINENPLKGLRYTVPPDLELYIRSDFDDIITEELDVKTLIKENFLMGFRYIDGPDQNLFYKRFNMDIEDAAPKTIKRWREKKLFQKEKTALTKDGLLFLNAFLTECFLEIDK